jgi:AraC-like DNA-binding protein
MHETLRGVDVEGLERSCSPRTNAIRFGPSAQGLERAEVFLSTCAFEPHRHDTYAIGVTLAGVQTFRYRGERRVCLPGELHVLHPDELHDGAAGTEDGFGYRILYVAPKLVREALGGGELPFVADPVQPASPSARVVESLLADIDEPIDDVARASIVAFVADALCALETRRPRARCPIDAEAVERVREYLDTHAAEQTPASTLEQIAGADRFTIARHFRRVHGTSPDRYRVLRRLGLARKAIESGEPLARAAADAGFADQSHMTRQFKRAYGLTPASWVNVVNAA